VWLALVALALWWGRGAIAGKGLGVNAAPLAGRWGWHPRLALVLPAAMATVVVAAGPRLAARASWRWVVALTAAATAVWTAALAVSDGWDRLTAPLTTRHEYEPYAAGIGGAGDFVRHFVERLPGAPVHVQGHPPGAPLVPWLLDRLGLGGAGWFALVVLAGWGVAVAASLVAARAVAGEAAARRAAPALVLLPAAVWAGTSADALFAAVLAVGVALAVSARPVTVAAGRTIGREQLTAATGGAVLGIGLLLTYGGAALVGIPVLLHLRRGRIGAAAAVVGGVAAVLVATAALTGFWWFDGLQATRGAYYDGVASDRPAPYFALVGNPGALAFALGPVVVVGLVAALRHRRDAASWLPLAGLLVVTVADLSLLSKGEVERIWLPFVPWLALAAPAPRRGALAVQVTLALLLQAGLRSKW
jgi:hypothetical protein